MRVLYLVFIIALSTHASAQDVIRMERGALADGTLLVYDTPTLAIDLRRIRVQPNGHYSVERLSSIKPDVLKNIGILNEDSLVTEYRYVNGHVKLFDPYSCYRIIGTCEFKMTLANQQTSTYSYVGRMVNGQLFVELFGEEKESISRTVLEFNKQGVLTFSGRVRSDSSVQPLLQLREIRQPGE